MVCVDILWMNALITRHWSSKKRSKHFKKEKKYTK